MISSEPPPTHSLSPYRNSFQHHQQQQQQEQQQTQITTLDNNPSNSSKNNEYQMTATDADPLYVKYKFYLLGLCELTEEDYDNFARVKKLPDHFLRAQIGQKKKKVNHSSSRASRSQNYRGNSFSASSSSSLPFGHQENENEDDDEEEGEDELFGDARLRNITKVDLSPFINVKKIGMCFCFGLEKCKEISFKPFEKNLVSVQRDFCWGCSNLKSTPDLFTPFKDSLKSIGEGFCAFCTSFEEVDLSLAFRNVVHVPATCFMGCKNVKKIDISSFNCMVESIEAGTFLLDTRPQSRNVKLIGATKLKHVRLTGSNGPNAGWLHRKIWSETDDGEEQEVVVVEKKIEIPEKKEKEEKEEEQEVEKPPPPPSLIRSGAINAAAKAISALCARSKMNSSCSNCPVLSKQLKKLLGDLEQEAKNHDVTRGLFEAKEQECEKKAREIKEKDQEIADLKRLLEEAALKAKQKTCC